MQTKDHRTTDVTLICMPFNRLRYPSPGLSLLKAGLAPLGVSTQILYFTFRLARMIGVDQYEMISHRIGHGFYHEVGEWIFSGNVFQQTDRDVEDYIENVLRNPSPANKPFLLPVSENLIRLVTHIRDVAGRLVDECLQQVLKASPRIVGFTCMFQQLMSSLSLAKQIKRHRPETLVVFGGTSCEGPRGAEIIDQFPYVDAVVSGEADIVFPQLVRRALKQKPLFGLQGVYTHNDPILGRIGGCYPYATPLHNMDDQPLVDYDDYFDQLKASGLQLYAAPAVQLETARGCWWGEKKQCTFCSLSETRKVFRAKSDRRAVDEVVYLADKYPGKAINLVDNVLNMDYFEDFIPTLSARSLDVALYCSVKSNLKKEHLSALSEAGVRMIKPGIESLNTSILGLMRKGTSTLQNIQLLKWCRELNLDFAWNLLWGFPSESPEAYAQMTALFPMLAHLQPPDRFGPIQVDRFSPYFENADQYGLANSLPSPAYEYIYPFRPESIARLALFFTYGYRFPQNVEAYTKPLEEAIYVWLVVHKKSDLFSTDSGEQLSIWDLRPIAVDPLTILTGLQRTLYLACDSTQSLSKLRRVVTGQTGRQDSYEKFEQLLQPMLNRYLMVREGNKYLSLAIPVGIYSPRPESIERIQRYTHNVDTVKQQQALMENIKLSELPRQLKIGKREMENIMFVHRQRT